MGDLSTWESGKRGALIPADIFQARDTVVIIANVAGSEGFGLSGAQVFMEILDNQGTLVTSLQGFSSDTGEAVLKWKTGRQEASGVYILRVLDIIKSGFDLLGQGAFASTRRAQKDNCVHRLSPSA